MRWDDHVTAGTKALEAADLQAAQEQFEAALTYAKKNFFHSDFRIPQTLVFLGQTYFSQRDYAAAQKLLTLAVQLADAGNFKDDLSIGMSLLCLAEIATSSDDAAEAKRYSKQATSILRKVLSEQELARITARVKKGTVPPPKPPPPSPAQSEKPPASQASESTKPVGKAKAKDTKRYETRLQLALADVRSEDLQVVTKAYVSLATELPEIIADTGPDSPITAQFLNIIGMAATALQMFDRAERAYKNAMDILSASMPATAPEIALIRLNLATLYVLEARYGEADEQFQQGMFALEKEPSVDRTWFDDTASAFCEVLDTWKLEKETDALIAQARSFEAKHNYGLASDALDAAFERYKDAPLARDLKFLEIFELQAKMLKKTGGSETDIAQLEQTVSEISAEEKARLAKIKKALKALPELPKT